MEVISQPPHMASTSLHRFFYQVFEKPDSRGSLEFRQQHRHHVGQNFAALQIAAYSDSETRESFLELLLLESTRDHTLVDSDGANEELYRRIGQVSLRKANEQSVGPEARPDHFNIRPVDNAPWYEVAEQKWPLKAVTIV
jgi:hypothetical protein